MKKDNTIVKFSYSRHENTLTGMPGETFDDGVATYLGFGIHLSMWGGEEAHYFTSVCGQDGSHDYKLVTSQVDSLDIKVKSWHFKVAYKGRGVGDDVYKESKRRAREIAREAAEAVSAGHLHDRPILSEDSIERIAAMLFDMSDYENG